MLRITAMVIALFGSSLASDLTTTSEYKLSSSIDYGYNKLIWILNYLTISAALYTILGCYFLNIILMIVIYLKTERKHFVNDDEDDEEFIDEIVYEEKSSGIKSIAVIEAHNNDGFEI